MLGAYRGKRTAPSLWRRLLLGGSAQRLLPPLLAILLVSTAFWFLNVTSLLRRSSHQVKGSRSEDEPGGELSSASGQKQNLLLVTQNVEKNHSASRGRNQSHFLTIIPRGRLGNQMFQYASLLGIARSNHRKPFVTSSCRVTHYFANTSVRDDVSTKSWSVLEEQNYAEKDVTFDSLPQENLRLKGFFQSWKYFVGIFQEIRRAFCYEDDVAAAVDALYRNQTQNLTRDVVKIGVHVRRTDMLHKMTRRQGYVIAPVTFLRKAMTYMRNRFGANVVFFVVSDDPDWCREALSDSSVSVVDSAPSVVHLGFLAKCQHVIMTVGTFGWWGAFLSGGCVVYYAGYPKPGSDISEGFKKEDYFLPDWIPIGD